MSNPIDIELMEEGIDPRTLHNPLKKQNKVPSTAIPRKPALEIVKNLRTQASEKAAEQWKKDANSEAFRNQRYSIAAKALKEVTIEYNGKTYNAIDLIFEKLIDESIDLSKKVEHFDEKRALVEKWTELALATVKCNFKTLCLLEPIQNIQEGSIPL